LTRNRLEAFSDGVMAIVITIMVLELRPPHGISPAALAPLLPVFLSYVLSFVHVGIYWNNHHHLFQAVQHVDGRTLWANLHLLFWLSLIPFVTAWMGENSFAAWPVALYGCVLVCSAIAYFVLTRALVARHGHRSALAAAVGRDLKGMLSVVVYLLGIGLAFVQPLVACGFYAMVALIWLVPDRRIERALEGGTPTTAER
jgi:uncharacterized membrane protein